MTDDDFDREVEKAQRLHEEFKRKPRKNFDKTLEVFTILKKLDSQLDYTVKKLPDFSLPRNSEDRRDVQDGAEDTANRLLLTADFLRYWARDEQ